MKFSISSTFLQMAHHRNIIEHVKEFWTHLSIFWFLLGFLYQILLTNNAKRNGRTENLKYSSQCFQSFYILQIAFKCQIQWFHWNIEFMSFWKLFSYMSSKGKGFPIIFDLIVSSTYDDAHHDLMFRFTHLPRGILKVPCEGTTVTSSKYWSSVILYNCQI